MAGQQRFPVSFKREVEEELLSESSPLAQLNRRYDFLGAHFALEEALWGRETGGKSLLDRESPLGPQCRVRADSGESNHGG